MAAQLNYKVKQVPVPSVWGLAGGGKQSEEHPNTQTLFDFSRDQTQKIQLCGSTPGCHA